MGQVRQATDTQLNRRIALKILPDAFASDPDRLARFTREAQILASLNHPNIAAIHGIEEAEGTRGSFIAFLMVRFSGERAGPSSRCLPTAAPLSTTRRRASTCARWTKRRRGSLPGSRQTRRTACVR